MLGNPQIFMTYLIAISSLLHWSGTKPEMSLRYACIRHYMHYTMLSVLFNSIDTRYNTLK